MLEAQQVARTAFGAGRRGEGYDEIEVDDFLDRLESTLREYEQGAAPADAVRSHELADISFRRARGFVRSGYDAAGVDALLVKARETLRVHEARTQGHPDPGPEMPSQQPSDVTSRAHHGEDAPHPSAISEAKPGLLSRLVRR